MSKICITCNNKYKVNSKYPSEKCFDCLFKKCSKCKKKWIKKDAKYVACFDCNFKKCTVCDKLAVKKDSDYDTCYNCFKKESEKSMF